MGSPGAGVPKGLRRPSHVAYYVALVGVLSLLLLLCLYFFYYFIKKVKELSSAESLSPPAAAYPVQPVVRDSATAMVKLCKQVPAPGKGDTVFPTSTSPAALRTDTGPEPGPASPGLPAPAQVQPASAQVQPAPAQVQPAPTQIQPAPAQVQPAPAQVQPAPAQVQPAPALAVPDKVQPVPAESAPAALDVAAHSSGDVISTSDGPISQVVTRIG